MMTDWTAALEATSLARALRASTWAYPLINAGHILGVALLVGAIVPLDLRLLGFWQSMPPAPLWRVLTRTAMVGLVLLVICGALLFIARASEYVRSGLFLSKMVFVAVGLANALVMHAMLWNEENQDRSVPMKAPFRVRIAAGVSLITWLTALLLGRLVGYF